MDDLMHRIALEAIAADATKDAKRREAAKVGADKVLGPPKPEPRPPADLFVDLEVQLQAIAQANAKRAADARRAYLDLLARMVPPRTGPAPPTDAHALAVRPEGGAPPSTEILTILHEARKTPEELRNDVRMVTTLRDDADRASTLPELDDAERAADLALDEEEQAFERVQAEWAIKIEVKRRLLDEAQSDRRRADDCLRRLERFQDVDGAVRRLRKVQLVSRAGPPPRDKAAQEKAAQEKAAQEKAVNDAERVLHEKARGLRLLEGVFFPPVPEPTSNVPRSEGWDAWLEARDEDR